MDDEKEISVSEEMDVPLEEVEPRHLPGPKDPTPDGVFVESPPQAVSPKRD